MKIDYDLTPKTNEERLEIWKMKKREVRQTPNEEELNTEYTKYRPYLATS